MLAPNLARSGYYESKQDPLMNQGWFLSGMNEIWEAGCFPDEDEGNDESKLGDNCGSVELSKFGFIFRFLVSTPSVPN